MKNRYFPLFVPSSGRNVLVVGAGTIGLRRIQTLMKFDFQVTVVCLAAGEEVKRLAGEGRITLRETPYSSEQLAGCFMVLACTGDRAVNHRIGQDAKERGLFVSVCDNREECNFFFPAVATGEEVTAGIAGTGENHGATKNAAAKVREIIEGKAY